MSDGFFSFTGTDEQQAHGVADTTEILLKDLLESGGYQNDEQLLKIYAERQHELYRWLLALGIKFDALQLSGGQSVARSHHTDPRKLLEKLSSRLAGTGRARVLTDHHVIELDRVDDTVTGVLACSPTGPVHVRAPGGVVLASGGFSRSAELLRIFAPHQLSAIPYGGLGNTGDGLRMAWKLGAGFRDMGYIAGTYGSHPDTTIEHDELLYAYYLGAIIVNTNGRRFADESLSYKSLGDACLRQPQGLGLQVFDHRVRARSRPGVPNYDIDFLEAKGRLFKADTLIELAARAGIDPDGLANTVTRYNAAARGESDDDFGRRALCNHTGELIEILQPPFYAYPAKTLMTSTYCGLTINTHAQVIDITGTPITGLYAAGEITGGFHGAAYMTGTSLGKAALFGRIAGQHAARQAVGQATSHT
jgi:flavocytochrome c